MVIVCDCKYRSSIIAIRSFYKCNKQVFAVTTDKDPNPPAFSSKYITKKYVFSSNPDTYKSQLLNLCQSFDMPLVFPCGNFTLNVLSEYECDFSHVAKFVVSSPSVLCDFNDKKWVKAKAEKCSIKVPRLYSISDEIPFPAVVKPFCGEKFNLKAQDRYKIVYDKKQLENAYQHFKSCSEDVLIEEYIQGDGIGVSVLLDNNSKFVTCFCHKRLVEYPIDGGPSSVLETFYDEALVGVVKEYFESLNFRGIAMAEFKKSGIDFYLLEVNPRIWGSFPATLKANSDFVDSYIAAASDIPSKSCSTYDRNKKIKFFRGTCMSALSYLKKGDLLRFLKVSAFVLNPFIPDATFSFSDLGASIKDLFRR